VLVGSVGVRFPITDGLEQMRRYEPSLQNMLNVIKTFA
jgi:hypothetical protein